MSQAMTPVNADDPRRIAWEAYTETPEYANARKWALACNYEDGREIRPEMREQNVEGSLWAAFIAGFEKSEQQLAEARAQGDKQPDHVCGLAGYGAPGDVCPACEWSRKRAGQCL